MPKVSEEPVMVRALASAVAPPIGALQNEPTRGLSLCGITSVQCRPADDEGGIDEGGVDER
jgi:hypothetical protein